MLYRDICRTLGFYLWFFLLPLSLPSCIAIYCDWIATPGTYPQPSSAAAFILTLLVTAILGALFYWIGRKGTGQLYRREALLLVLIVYFLTPAVGGLPFLLNKTFQNPLDSYFEAVSALTTTGATLIFPKKYDPQTGREIPYIKTIDAGKKTTYTFYGTIKPVQDPVTHQQLEGLSAVSVSLLFWRSFMQWLGGGGIVVLVVAILPALGVGGKFLFQTEVTGPTKDSMLPRIKETASKLWKIYLTLTVIEIFLLMATQCKKMSLFDAITVSMATISTGGLVPRNEGISYYDSPYIDSVVMAFMIFGSVNFSLYFYCVRGRFSRLKDPETKIFFAILLLACLFAAWQLSGTLLAPLIEQQTQTRMNFLQALRYGAFQMISAQSSTGFATANFDLWPFSVQVLMLILMFIGGMAGSTAGGIKVIRIQTFFRILLNKIESIYRPDTVRTYRIGNAVIDQHTATTVLCLIMIAASLIIVGTFLLVFDGVDPETSLTTITCMANNGGFAFRMGGPTESFAFLSVFGKILSCFWMIAGRLEYYALLIAFIPAFWRTTY